jgi:hypothetical protein
MRNRLTYADWREREDIIERKEKHDTIVKAETDEIAKLDRLRVKVNITKHDIMCSSCGVGHSSSL